MGVPMRFTSRTIIHMLYKHVYCDFNAFQVAFRPPRVHWQPGIPRDASTCLAFAVLRDFLTGATSPRCRPTTQISGGSSTLSSRIAQSRPSQQTGTMPKTDVRKNRGVSRSVNSSQPSKSRFLRSKPPTTYNMSALAAEREKSRDDYRKQFSSE